MSEEIDVFGIKMTASQVRTLHDQFTSENILMGLIKHMREQTKETLSQPDAEGPTSYRTQGNAIAYAKLLTLPEVIANAVGTLGD